MKRLENKCHQRPCFSASLLQEPLWLTWRERRTHWPYRVFPAPSSHCFGISCQRRSSCWKDPACIRSGRPSGHSRRQERALSGTDEEDALSCDILPCEALVHDSTGSWWNSILCQRYLWRPCLYGFFRSMWLSASSQQSRYHPDSQKAWTSLITARTVPYQSRKYSLAKLWISLMRVYFCSWPTKK